VIDEIRITGMAEWQAERVQELHRELATELPSDVRVRLVDDSVPVRIELRLPGQWPNLKRENLARITEKRLNKLEHDHGLAATVEKIDETEREDRDATFR